MSKSHKSDKQEQSSMPKKPAAPTLREVIDGLTADAMAFEQITIMLVLNQTDIRVMSSERPGGVPILDGNWLMIQLPRNPKSTEPSTRAITVPTGTPKELPTVTGAVGLAVDAKRTEAEAQAATVAG